MKSFDVLHEGNKVWNEEDGTMSVAFCDVNSDGKRSCASLMTAAFTRPASLTLLTGSCWRTRRAEQ